MQITTIEHIRQNSIMRCVHSIHFICKISFIHHIWLFMVQDQQGLPSQIRHCENCWLACISPTLMFVFLISLTIISQFLSKEPLFLMWLQIIPFFSALDAWLKLAAWKSLNWNPVFKSFFDQTNYHHIYTQLMHVVLA